jgi:uncharacterized membrane protein YhaH (DUF805 family)
VNSFGSLVPLLTSFHGRISRKPWWIGLAIWILGNMSGMYLFDPDLFTSDEVPRLNWPDTVWQLAWLVPLAAITAKRCNDRDWPSWLAYAFVALYAVYILGPQFGLLLVPGAPTVGGLAFWIVAMAQVFMLIDNGFFHGTDGPNWHGPDPLSPDAHTAQ